MKLGIWNYSFLRAQNVSCNVNLRTVCDKWWRYNLLRMYMQCWSEYRELKCDSCVRVGASTKWNAQKGEVIHEHTNIVFAPCGQSSDPDYEPLLDDRYLTASYVNRLHNYGELFLTDCHGCFHPVARANLTAQRNSKLDGLPPNLPKTIRIGRTFPNPWHIWGSPQLLVSASA